MVRGGGRTKVCRYYGIPPDVNIIEMSSFTLKAQNTPWEPLHGIWTELGYFRGVMRSLVLEYSKKYTLIS